MRFPLSTKYNCEDYNGLRCLPRFGQRPLSSVLSAPLSDNPSHTHPTPNIRIDQSVVSVGRLRDDNDYCYLADTRPSSQVDNTA